MCAGEAGGGGGYQQGLCCSKGFPHVIAALHPVGFSRIPAQCNSLDLLRVGDR